MKFQNARWVVVGLAALMLPTLASLGSTTAQAASNQGLIVDSWNGAFNTANNPNPNVAHVVNAYSDTTTNLSGYPYQNIIIPGFPNPVMPTLPVVTPPPTGSGPITTDSLTVPNGSNNSPVSYPQLPFALTGDPVAKCFTQSITATGFPFGPITVTWSAVSGATDYEVKVGAIPPGANYYVTMSVLTVHAPALHGTLALDHSEVVLVFQQHMPFVVTVAPIRDHVEDCQSVLQLTTAVVRTPPPVIVSTGPDITVTPGSSPGSSNGPTGGSPTNNGNTNPNGGSGVLAPSSPTQVPILVVRPPIRIVLTCPSGYQGTPPNCLPILK